MTNAKCPICGKPPDPVFHPFCSSRCANVDLHRWLAGAYSISEPNEDGAVRGEGESDDDT